MAVRAPVWPRLTAKYWRRLRIAPGAGGVARGGDGPLGTAERPTALGFASVPFLVALALGGLAASVALASWASGAPHTWRDVTIEAAIRAHMTPTLTAIMVAMSRLGNWRAIALTVPLLAGLLLLRGRPARAAALLASVGGGAMLVVALKPLIDRLGPSGWPNTSSPLGLDYYAFPSGHAVYFLTCLLPLVWFALEWRPRGSTSWRIAAQAGRIALCLGLLALVGLGGCGAGISRVSLAERCGGRLCGRRGVVRAGVAGVYTFGARESAHAIDRRAHVGQSRLEGNQQAEGDGEQQDVAYGHDQHEDEDLSGGVTGLVEGIEHGVVEAGEHGDGKPNGFQPADLGGQGEHPDEILGAEHFAGEQ
jgi:hypothetical protein